MEAISSSEALDAMSALCGELFCCPRRLVKVHVFPIAPRHRLELHNHTDLLQVDLALGGQGHWTIDGQRATIDGPTVAVFYPFQMHSFALDPLDAGARVLSLKIQVEPSWPAIRERALGCTIANITGVEPLVHSWQRAIWAFNDPHAPTFTRMLRTVDLLGALALLHAEQQRSGTLLIADPTVEAAMHYLEQHIDRLVKLEELAEAVHLSPRQLTRRFLAACGRSPSAYAAERRRAIATDMLQQRQISVTQVAESLGFASIHSFSHWYKKQTGYAPETLLQSRLPR